MYDLKTVMSWLEGLIEDDWEEWYSHSEVQNTAKAAMELLKEQEADKWISVTERLPEVRNAVLCYSPHHNNIWALSLHEDGEWYYWIPLHEKYNPDFEGPITHWRPLPEHPKEGR